MPKTLYSLLTLAALSWATTLSSAAVTASQTVSMSIASSSTLTTSGNPGALAVTLNSAGTGSATDATTSYTVLCNTGAAGSLKITGAITSGGNMPTNTALSVNLASTSGTSQGAQSLSTTAVDLVTKLPTLLADTGAITYTFSVNNGWTVSAQTLNRTVTFTLTST